ncbi:ANTAR domain-containing protein [Amycolatopsis sp. CA-230715]|uniref:ANTAR domain-containing protein n=1 Tax=Amycolatopsis sp. CA-230715 TaxID=2745196 RepID=UPI001C02315A|nr:ANTAR domain-containing protein [Amycolatopsis sp. CA-230715]QWF86056.1 hypothetical protein HUW46_09537 [Amycolatopsis sp. CA-230715]
MDPAGGVETPLGVLLDGVLAGVRRDVPGEVGTAISVAHPTPRHGGGQLRVLAATGVGRVLPPITTGHLWGPSLLVAADEQPIVTADLWHDERWPHLTVDAVRDQVSGEHRDVVSKVRGAAAVPGVWDGDGVVVLSAYFDGPADHSTVAVLVRHERLVASAITIASIATRSADEAEQTLDALASRAMIEQAKGAIMALRRVDADEAWAILRRASQEFNVKLRELALALVEYAGRAPVEQEGDTRRHVSAGADARTAATLVWQALAAPEVIPSEPA